MKLIMTCKNCKSTYTLEVNQKAYRDWKEGTSIQHAFPTWSPIKRDSLLTSMCQDCLSKIYNCPKDGEDWGEVVTECECCGCNLYERNKVAENAYKCPTCKEVTHV